MTVPDQAQHIIERGQVLVIDDEAEILKTLRRQLRKEFDVYPAKNAEEGLAIMRQRPIQIIVSDQRMPGMQGAELLKHAKEKYPDAIRLLLTGYADIEAVIQAINEGQVFGYISKPWNPDELLATLRKAYKKYRTTDRNQRLLQDLKRIVNAMPSIVVSVDLEGQVTEWNQSAEQVTGISAAQAIGCCIEILLPQFDLLDKVSEAIHDRRPLPAERLATEKDAKLHYSDLIVYPLLLADEPRGAVIRIDDVTERVHLEQMLLQTDKMLSVGGLAAGLAHELNNPLSIVLQGSQNILRRLSYDLPRNRVIAEKTGIKLEQVRNYLEKNQILKFLNSMNEAAQRAARIVADMMTFADCRHMDFSPAKLEDMLDTALQSGHYNAALTGDWDLSQILIVRDYDPALGPVRCNRKAIERVFLNLIKNAAQAIADSAKPSPRITLRTYREDDWVCVKIEDNGPGLDEKARRHLFEPFFTTKPPGVGIGLGLSVAYFIVTEQHGGQITVSSTPGQETCFTVSLPLLRKPHTNHH